MQTLFCWLCANAASFVSMFFVWRYCSRLAFNAFITLRDRCRFLYMRSSCFPAAIKILSLCYEFLMQGIVIILTSHQYGQALGNNLYFAMAKLSPEVYSMVVQFCPLSPQAGFTCAREVCVSFNTAWLKLKGRVCRDILRAAINNLKDEPPEDPRDPDTALLLLLDLQDVL
jgi:hypothetical protein